MANKNVIQAMACCALCSVVLIAGVVGCTTAQVAEAGAAIAPTCNAVQNGLAAVATVDKGATPAVGQAQAIAAASCTAAGQVVLAANDGQPVTATNSGNSAAWLTTLLSDAETAAKIATAVAPML